MKVAGFSPEVIIVLTQWYRSRLVAMGARFLLVNFLNFSTIPVSKLSQDFLSKVFEFVVHQRSSPMQFPDDRGLSPVL